MKYFVIFVSLIFLHSCSGNRSVSVDSYETIRYKESKIDGNKSIRLDYLFNIPKGGSIYKEYAPPGDRYYVEYRVSYADSAIIYISNNNWNGSRINYKNRYDIGTKDIVRKENDTLYLGGVQKNGKYWKENISNEITVGYFGVSKAGKEKFDKALNSVRVFKKN